jgi:hypothetical protein
VADPGVTASFNWKYTTNGLNDLLARLPAHERTPSLALAA